MKDYAVLNADITIDNTPLTPRGFNPKANKGTGISNMKGCVILSRQHGQQPPEQDEINSPTSGREFKSFSK